MKSFLLVLFMLLAANCSLSAQNLIAVQNGGNPAFYTNLDTALISALNGDTIFIPGGIFNITRHIDKRLHLIGVGHHPDSTKTTHYTFILGEIYLVSGSDNSSVIGLFCNNIQFGTDSLNSEVHNVTIKRCNFDDIRFFLGGATSSEPYPHIGPASGNIFIENIIKSFVSLNFTKNNLILNNIIVGKMQFCGTNNIISNNIFLAQGHQWNDGGAWSALESAQNSIIKNNIFLSTISPLGCTYLYWTTNVGMSGCDIKNNVFCIPDPGSFCYPCFSSDNYYGINPSNIFIDQTGNSFSYSNNYHLQNPSDYLGTDGTEVGIYGGAFPWKEGSIPFNPHFQQVQIAPKTDNQGNLNVNIMVKAQDH